ncbi:RTN4RL2 [Branchiostoma lanceolatum]|uniref:RTN4RL2 protein n=1 Tax=Branchiostoma lanceolatum TaxID=7740 RepID=A0A8K0EI41_BRALA|nr:RTN4RL2 [Branchiostoma lanceolatum]
MEDNLIYCLDDDTFLGLEELKHLYLQKNGMSVISKHAFRGLPVLKDVWLYDNHLRSVPIDALLQPKALKVARLANNRITMIDERVMRLNENRHFFLMLGHNKLNCDRNLTWLICNLWRLDVIPQRNSLTCASPPNLRGRLIRLLKKEDLNTDIKKPSPVEWYKPSWDEIFIRADTASTSSEHPQNVSTLLYDQTASNHTDVTLYANNTTYNETAPAENYTYTPYTGSMFASRHTTEMVYIHLFGRDAIINLDDNKSNLVAMILAVFLPLVLMLALAIVLCLQTGLVVCNIPTDAENEEPADFETVEPYAVVYMDSIDLQASGKDSANGSQPITDPDQSEGNSTIQPHAQEGKEETNQSQVIAVIHHEDPGTEPQSCAVTHKEDQRQERHPPEITHDDDPGPEFHPHKTTHNIDPGAELHLHKTTHDDNPAGSELSPHETTHKDNQWPELHPHETTHDDDPGPQLHPHETTHNDDPGAELHPPETTHGDDPGPQLHPHKTTHNDDPGAELHPPETTHGDDPGPQLHPYAVTYDSGQDDNSIIQPYAIAYLNSPQTTKPHGQTVAAPETTPTHQETLIKQPLAQSTSNTEPHYVNKEVIIEDNPQARDDNENATDKDETFVKQPLNRSRSTASNIEPHYVNKEVFKGNPQARDYNVAYENATDQDETFVKQPLARSFPTRADTEPNYWKKEVDKVNTRAKDGNSPFKNATDQDETCIKKPFTQSEDQSQPTAAEFNPKDEEGDRNIPGNIDEYPYGMGKKKEIRREMLYGGGSQDVDSGMCSESRVLYNSCTQPSGCSVLYEEPSVDNEPSHEHVETANVSEEETTIKQPLA